MWFNIVTLKFVVSTMVIRGTSIKHLFQHFSILLLSTSITTLLPIRFELLTSHLSILALCRCICFCIRLLLRSLMLNTFLRKKNLWACKITIFFRFSDEVHTDRHSGQEWQPSILRQGAVWSRSGWEWRHPTHRTHCHRQRSRWM